MKKTMLLSFALVLLLGHARAQGINDPNAETRNVENFHAITVSSGISLMLSQGSQQAVAVSAEENDLKSRIKTVVKNGVLKIYFDNDNGKIRNRKLKAYVSFVQLDGLDASAGASVNVDGSIKVNKLDLGASSGAVFNGKVETEALNVNQSSGSVVNISGNVNDLNFDGSSGSIFKGYELKVQNCNAQASSGSGVRVTVNKELSVTASSGGYVSYKGDGVIRSISTSSGGNVKKG